MFKKIDKKRPIVGVSFILCLMSALFLPLASATSEIVSSDYHYADKFGMSAILYKDIGEQDPESDFYSLKVMLADTEYLNNPIVGPFNAHVRLAVLYTAQEPPGNHLPEAGWAWDVNTVSFGFEGISYNMKIPAYSVSYNTEFGDFWEYYDWDLSSDYYGFAFGFLFKDYTEFSVGLTAPEGYQCEVYVQGVMEWYLNEGFIFVPWDYDSYNWLHVQYSGYMRGMSGSTSESMSEPPILPIPFTPLIHNTPVRAITASEFQNIMIK